MICGPAGFGKSPFARALAAYWTMGYLGEDKEGTVVPLDRLHFDYCGTVANLNRVTAHGFMQRYVPIVVDDSDLQDSNQQRTGGGGDFHGLRAGYIKHMLNVQDGGECGARFNQTQFSDLQPRIFVVNDRTADAWLPAGETDEHKQAIYKRLAVCELTLPLIEVTAREDRAAKLKELGEAMVARNKRLAF